MPNLLFSTEPTNQSIVWLKNSGFSDFAANSNLLTLDFNDSIEGFLETHFATFGKPFFRLSPFYNSVTHEKKFRFLYICVNDDVVFAIYKVVQIYATKNIRFFGFPISKKNDKETEKIVLDLLRSKPFVSFLTQEYRDNSQRICMYDDYFYNLDNKTKRYETSKYRSKNYINVIEKNENFSVTFGDSRNVKALEILRQHWAKGKEHRGEHVNATDTTFNKIITSNDNDLYFLTVFYKNRAISLQVFFKNDKHHYCDCLYILHLWDACGDETLQKALNNIVEIQKYLSWKFLYKRGVNRIYLAGCRESNRKLLAHKERISDGKLEYFIKYNDYE